MSSNRKATFVLPVSLLEELRQMVDRGMAESVSALVRDSVESRLRQLREELLAEEFRQAADDPLFMADLEECTRDFSAVDGEMLE
ncbi:MAG: hypothetical protein AB1758_32665 [Candidatus Eremiobacterota bacterium]